jgi:hypothetical protein
MMCRSIASPQPNENERSDMENRMTTLKQLLIIFLVLGLLWIVGCESSWGSAGLGAAGGAVAAGGGYEYVINREMTRIEDALKAGEMDQREYEIRKDQIERMSLIK